MKQKTIKARVSQKGIAKVHLLFDNNPETLLSEVLQNCRRAKATKVEIQISFSSYGENFNEIVVSDNGEGINNPESLLHLWNSDWDKETQDMESPAGLGFFSLCNLKGGVTVRSNTWRCHIDPAIFRGEGEAIVEDSKESIKGTEIAFSLEFVGRDGAKMALAKCLKYFPIPALVNGKMAEQMDFLQDAEFIYECPGGRIGVKTKGWNDCINFYGIHIEYRNLVPEDWGRKYSCLVDIFDNQILDLVLPARNAIVENEKLESLKLEVKNAIFTFIREKKKAHTLPFYVFKEAKNHGIEIPEAIPCLELFMPVPLQDALNLDYFEKNGWNGPIAKNYDSLITEKQTPEIMKEAILCARNRTAEIAALHIPGEVLPAIYKDDKMMEGYSWYPTKVLGPVNQILIWDKPKRTFIIGPDDFINIDRYSKENLPDNILVEAEVISFCQENERISIKTYIAFPLRRWADLETWIPSKKPMPSKIIDITLLAKIYFTFYEDANPDDYDNDCSDFSDRAHADLIRILHGENEYFLQKIVCSLNECNDAFRSLKAKEIVIGYDKHHQLTIKSYIKRGEKGRTIVRNLTGIALNI